MLIGERIKILRKQKKLTQEKLANLAGVATISIRQYESGNRTPHINQLKAIADVLEVPVTHFLDIEKAVQEEVANINASHLLEEGMGQLVSGLLNAPEDEAEDMAMNISSLDGISPLVAVHYMSAMGAAYRAGISPKDLENLINVVGVIKNSANNGEPHA